LYKSCTIGGYNGGINMCEWGAKHPNDLTCALNGGPPSGYLLGKPPTSEFQGGPPFGR
jgi:hypothetical protein